MQLYYLLHVLAFESLMIFSFWLHGKILDQSFSYVMISCLNYQLYFLFKNFGFTRLLMYGLYIQEQFTTLINDNSEVTCWGCGLRLLLPSQSPIFKCGWCGAVTNQNTWKQESNYFKLRHLRDRSFVCVLLVFMLFVICTYVVVASVVLLEINIDVSFSHAS